MKFCKYHGIYSLQKNIHIFSTETKIKLFISILRFFIYIHPTLLVTFYTKT